MLETDCGRCGSVGGGYAGSRRIVGWDAREMKGWVLREGRMMEWLCEGDWG